MVVPITRCIKIMWEFGIFIEFYRSLSCLGEEFNLHIHFYLKYPPLNTFVAKVQRIWRGHVVKLWEFEEQTDVKHNFLLRQKLWGIERRCQKMLLIGLELIINAMKIMHYKIVFFKSSMFVYDNSMIRKLYNKKRPFGKYFGITYRTTH